jgi:toxin ParE1/3/4
MAHRERRVIWSDAALSALEQVLDHIAADSPQSARHVGEQAIAAADSLATLSERGRIVPEVGDPNVREIFVFRYRLMYELTATEVRILAFVHGARDFSSFRRE